MKTLDVESLLDLNPLVDQEAVKARQQKILQVGPRTNVKGGSASPYGGKRAVPADKPSASRLIRRSR